ncbi:hypothetical protein D6764_03730 [Candidatus Woesearchaeota archaeon]|nr:MAG: hypothetical protein D6764_03730 [Candidatus Woesearchaeota archaeon]
MTKKKTAKKSEKKQKRTTDKEEKKGDKPDKTKNLVLVLIIAGVLLVAFGAGMLASKKSAEKKAQDAVEEVKKQVEDLTGKCSVPEDCEGLPHIMCVGNWVCKDGMCGYECKTEEVKEENTAENTGPDEEAAQEEEAVQEGETVEEGTQQEFIPLSEETMNYVEEEVKTRFVVLSPAFKSVRRGTTFETALGVKNNGVRDETFRVEATFKRAYTPSNQPIIGLNEEEMTNWIDTGEEFTLSPKEYRIVKIAVSVPMESSIESGTYEFGIQAQKKTHKWEDYYGEYDLAVKVE